MGHREPFIYIYTLYIIKCRSIVKEEEEEEEEEEGKEKEKKETSEGRL